jgi:hypothetical protein
LGTGGAHHPVWSSPPLLAPKQWRLPSQTRQATTTALGADWRTGDECAKVESDLRGRGIMIEKRCSHCGLYEDRFDTHNNHLCAFSSCPRRNRLARTLRRMAWIAFLVVLAIVLTALLSWSAQASECYSIRDYSRKMECLAVERGEPADCMGVREPDRRVICRGRAEQGKRSRQWRWEQ